MFGRRANGQDASSGACIPSTASFAGGAAGVEGAVFSAHVSFFVQAMTNRGFSNVPFTIGLASSPNQSSRMVV